MLDDTLLADPRALAALDTRGVLRSAATAGAQVRSAAYAAAEAGVGDLAGTRPRAVVLLRRPGASATAAGVLAAVLEQAPVPVLVTDVVPGWIGPLDVVIGHTADATDAELADSVSLAVLRGAEVVLSAPIEGPVASAGAGRARLVEPRIPVPPGLDLPRALAVGLATVEALDLLDTSLHELEPLADELDAEAERNQPGHEPFMNPAKSLALRFAEHTPLLWGTDSLAATVAQHAVAALATHAGVVAHADDVARATTASGLLHALDRSAAGADIFRDPFDDPDGAAETPPVRLVLLATAEDDPAQVSLRRAGRSWPSADVLHPVEEVARGTGHAALLRAGLLASRLDVAAVYLGLATRTNEPAYSADAGSPGGTREET